MSELIAYVAVPTRGLINPAVMSEISQFAIKLGTAPVYMEGHLSAGMTRNKIVHHFLQTGDDVLVMVDDDVVPSRHAPRLLDHIADGWDIVAAANPIFQPKTWPLPYIAAYREVESGYELIPEEVDGLVECDAVGTGCIAIHRRVLEALPAPFRELIDETGEIVSDDMVFCKQASAAGFKIAVDYGARCDHHCRVSLGAVMQGVAAFRRQLVAAEA